jgi:hypothetical protein
LKRRIFFSDRFEKVEKTLLAMNLIPSDHFYCSDEDLEVFKAKLYRKESEALMIVNAGLQVENDDVWFDIYRSVSGGGAHGGGDTEADRKRQWKVERRR